MQNENVSSSSSERPEVQSMQSDQPMQHEEQHKKHATHQHHHESDPLIGSFMGLKVSETDFPPLQREEGESGGQEDASSSGLGGGETGGAGREIPVRDLTKQEEGGQEESGASSLGRQDLGEGQQAQSDIGGGSQGGDLGSGRQEGWSNLSGSSSQGGDMGGSNLSGDLGSSQERDIGGSSDVGGSNLSGDLGSSSQGGDMASGGESSGVREEDLSQKRFGEGSEGSSSFGQQYQGLQKEGEWKEGQQGEQRGEEQRGEEQGEQQRATVDESSIFARDESEQSKDVSQGIQGSSEGEEGMKGAQGSEEQDESMRGVDKDQWPQNQGISNPSYQGDSSSSSEKNLSGDVTGDVSGGDVSGDVSGGDVSGQQSSGKDEAYSMDIKRGEEGQQEHGFSEQMGEQPLGSSSGEQGEQGKQESWSKEESSGLSSSSQGDIGSGEKEQTFQDQGPQSSDLKGDLEQRESGSEQRESGGEQRESGGEQREQSSGGDASDISNLSQGSSIDRGGFSVSEGLGLFNSGSLEGQSGVEGAPGINLSAGEGGHTQFGLPSGQDLSSAKQATEGSGSYHDQKHGNVQVTSFDKPESGEWQGEQKQEGVSGDDDRLHGMAKEDFI